MTEITEVPLDWFAMGMGFIGGLALFLYGMELMIQGLIAYSGERMRQFLQTLTHNRISGALTGAGVTAVIQSSSATTVIVVGFISAGMLSLAQGISIIMGANLGTTMTAQIVAFKITNYALLMLAIGFLWQFMAHTNKQRSMGKLILGLGLLFFGMSVMSDAMSPLRDYAPFLELMSQMQNPFFGILVGLIFTALVQSSSATIGVIIVLASNGFLTLPAGIALALGADIGTCVTALLAAIGKTRDAIRAAVGHVLFNILGVVIWLPFLPFLADAAIWMSAGDAQLAGTAVLGSSELAANTPREIANANSLFKLTALLMFLPLLGLFVWAVYRIVPITMDEKQENRHQPRYLDDIQLLTPSLALQAVEKEVARLGNSTYTYYRRVMDAVLKQDAKELNKLERESHHLLQLHTAILLYLGQLKNQPLDDQQNRLLLKFVSQLDQFESMVDVLNNELLQSGHQMLDHDIIPSAAMIALIEGLNAEVSPTITNGFKACTEQDVDAIQLVMVAKKNIDRYINDALEHQVNLLNATPERLRVLRIEMQLMDSLKRLYTLSKRAVKIEERYLASQEILASASTTNLS